jgi:predicted CoA-binding protein
MPLLESEDSVRELLTRVRRIAVVGLSPKPHRDSHRVALYMQQRGYEIVPVYPRGGEILGARVYQRVQDIPGGVDLVDVFRRPEAIPEVVDDVLASVAAPGAPALWFQLGCVHEDATRRAVEAGLPVVLDQCLMVEHAALLGRGWTRDPR